MREYRQGNLKAILNDNQTVTVKRFNPGQGTEAILYTLSKLATIVHAEAGFQLFQDVIESQAWLDMERQSADVRALSYINNQKQAEIVKARKEALAAMDKLKLLGADLKAS